MSYLVSARRWRPQTFEDLVGQEHVSRTLGNAIRAGRVAHAFLFTGVRGVGKTTAARILAKALNCEQGPTPVPCNACPNCQEITGGSSVDVLEIDGASNTGVDDVREIIENVRYRPAKSRFKIYIIDEVHMLSNSAFNALLKTLEEPPAHVKFIFATTDPHKMPATVQSRCQRYDFRRIPLRLVVDRLRRIVEEERVRISDRALYVLAREGEGSMRDAQSLLDQVLAYGAEVVSDEDVLATLGIADRKVIVDLSEALIGRDPARALQLLESVHAQGYDMRRLARDVLEQFRDLAVLKVTNGALLPELADEEVTALRQQAERVTSEDCDRAFRVLQEVDEEVARSAYPKLVLEMALIRLAGLPPLLPIDDLLGRIEELEGRLRRGGPAAAPAGGTSAGAERPRAREAKPSAEAPAPASAPPAVAGPRSWEGFLAFVTTERAPLAHHLTRCTPTAVDGPVIELRAPRGFCQDYLARRDHVEEMEELAARYCGRAVKVSVTAQEKAAEADEPTRREAQPSGAVMTQEALGNPVVRAAVEILGGEVADVRPRGGRKRGDA